MKEYSLYSNEGNWFDLTNEEAKEIIKINNISKYELLLQD